MNSVIINVTGKKFEISTASFGKFPVGFASRFTGAQCDFKKHKQIYFFERHPEVFGYVLYYYLHGELHMPRSTCPALFKKELEFWGLDVSCLENCCLDVYGMAFENLRTLDDFEKEYEVKSDENSAGQLHTNWGRIQTTMWQILDNPFASKLSEVFYWLSILFVSLSIFAIIASTHPLFNTYSKSDGSESFAEHLEWNVGGSHEGESGDIIYDDGETYHDGFSDFNTTDVNESSWESTSVWGSSGYNYHRIIEIALLEFICFIFFTVEVILKLMFCPKLKVFFSSTLNVVDLLVILPRYILILLGFVSSSQEALLKVEGIVEAVAVLRVFRLLRLGRRVRGLRVLIYAIKSGLKDVLLLCLMLFMATIIFASLMYYIDTHQEFPSIPHGLWWAIVTLTTVGYGDMTPQTAGGKLLGSMCAITGLLIVAMTVPIFVSKFLLYYNHVARKTKAISSQSQPCPVDF